MKFLSGLGAIAEYLVILTTSLYDVSYHLRKPLMQKLGEYCKIGTELAGGQDFRRPGEGPFNAGCPLGVAKGQSAQRFYLRVVP